MRCEILDLPCLSGGGMSTSNRTRNGGMWTADEEKEGEKHAKDAMLGIILAEHRRVGHHRRTFAWLIAKSHHPCCFLESVLAITDRPRVQDNTTVEGDGLQVFSAESGRKSGWIRGTHSVYSRLTSFVLVGGGGTRVFYVWKPTVNTSTHPIESRFLRGVLSVTVGSKIVHRFDSFFFC